MAALQFVVIGDLQETSFLERTLLRRESNPQIPDLLVKQILSAPKSAHPQFVVLLGDLVTGVFTQNAWKRSDRIVRPFHRAKIPLYACLGNHDVPRSSFLKRFPFEQPQVCSVVRIQNLAMIFLNSCANDGDFKKQMEWLIVQLNLLNHESEIQQCIVFSHHPPFSQSISKRDQPRLRSDILPMLLACDKFKMWISGHAHVYEHFQFYDRHFLVSGGGGAPRIKVDQKSICPFHYLNIQIDTERNATRVTSISLNESTPFDEFDY